MPPFPFPCDGAPPFPFPCDGALPLELDAPLDSLRSLRSLRLCSCCFLARSAAAPVPQNPEARLLQPAARAAVLLHPPRVAVEPLVTGLAL